MLARDNKVLCSSDRVWIMAASLEVSLARKRVRLDDSLQQQSERNGHSDRELVSERALHGYAVFDHLTRMRSTPGD